MSAEGGLRRERKKEGNYNKRTENERKGFEGPRK